MEDGVLRPCGDARAWQPRRGLDPVDHAAAVEGGVGADVVPERSVATRDVHDDGVRRASTVEAGDAGGIGR